MAALRPLLGGDDYRIVLSLGFTFAHDDVDTAIVGTVNPEHMKTNILAGCEPTWGGEMAPLSPAESAKGILEVVERLTTADAGKFYTHEGKELP